MKFNHRSNNFCHLLLFRRKLQYLSTRNGRGLHKVWIPRGIHQEVKTPWGYFRVCLLQYYFIIIKIYVLLEKVSSMGKLKKKTTNLQSQSPEIKATNISAHSLPVFFSILYIIKINKNVVITWYTLVWSILFNSLSILAS